MRKKKRLRVVVILVIIVAVVFGGVTVFKSAIERFLVNDKKQSVVMVESDITQKQKIFGAWINGIKYKSIDDLKENMGNSSMVVFGSSEFNHGNDSIYHPSNVFLNTNVNLMMIGTAYNQSLNLATYLGAMTPDIKNKKVVLFLSPSWFYSRGTTKDYYTQRFSEGAYILFMENKSISSSEKQYMANRTLALLNDKKKKKRVIRYNKVLLYGKGTAKDISYIKNRKEKLKEKNHENIEKMMKKKGLDNLSDKKMTYNPFYKIDWKELIKSTVDLEKKNGNRTNNPYYFDNDRYDTKYQALSQDAAGSQINSSFQYSPEYEDLRLFLDICKEHSIKVMLVLQPQSGYWYDMTGLTADKRNIIYSKIEAMSKEYNCTLAEFKEFEYEKYFLLDSVHLGSEGWSMINEQIEDFYNN